MNTIDPSKREFDQQEREASRFESGPVRPVGAPKVAPEVAPELPGRWNGPGLMDVQVNGYGGFDFNGPAESWTVETLSRIAAALRRRGVTVALPTLITDAPESMAARAGKYAELLKSEPSLAETFLRLHIEGPFISPEDGPRGAHPRAHCATPRDRPGLIDELREASGDRIGIVSLAPELPGAMRLIARLAADGLCVAIAHTMASPPVLREAVDAGARLSTHLGNGSHQTLPRLDNYIQAQLADDRLCASFIADGHHMPFTTLKNFIRAKGPERSILTTDAMAAADVGPGRYRLGAGEVVVTEDLYVSIPGQLNLAGSALTLDRAIMNACLHAGVSFAEAWAMASSRPAALLGLPSPATVSVEIGADGFRSIFPV